MEDNLPLTILFMLGAIAFVVWQSYAKRKRRDAMRLLAKKLGLRFDESRDHNLPQRHAFLGKLAQGSNRYAFNVMSGDYQGHPVTLFDFHFETHSGSGSKRQTHHHYLSFFILSLSADFPELTIEREGIFSKIGQALGYDDIDFESHDFSRQYVVRCPEKKFAYDFCNAQMIEYLLQRRINRLEVERTSLAISFGSKLGVDQIEYQLKHLLKVRSLMPDYLFTD